MSLETLLTQDVIIQTPATTTDRYGDTIDDWSAPRERPAKAWVAQVSSSEDHDHRDATTVTAIATFFLSAQLTGRERVLADGLVYEVEGAPTVARTPRGPHHLKATLHSVAG